MTNSSDTIGNLTRDLPACSAVPQPTAQPAACTGMPNYVLKINDMTSKTGPLFYLTIAICQFPPQID